MSIINYCCTTGKISLFSDINFNEKTVQNYTTKTHMLYTFGFKYGIIQPIMFRDI